MTHLDQWAKRYNVPPAALDELLALCFPSDVPPTVAQPPQSEAAVQQQVRLEAARRGLRLWRNNIGATQDETGRVIRYGLCNDSAQMNKKLKSSDLIGITPVTCQCGHRYGVFTAYEIKAQGWKFRASDERAVAQQTFLQLVTMAGGIAKFITRAEDL